MLRINSCLKICLIIAISITVLNSSLYSQTEAERMVSISLDNSSALVKTDKQKNILAKIKQRETTAKVEIFEVKDIEEIINSTSLRFGTNNETIHSVNKTENKLVKGNTNLWQGKAAEIEGNMTTLIFSENDITGSVWFNGKMYRIEPLGDGVHAFIEEDQSKALDCGEPLENKEEQKEEKTFNKAEAIESLPTSIDVLVAYTTAAKNASGNINSLIQLAVTEANQSYQNSDVEVRMNLVHTYEVNYTESGNTLTDLQKFTYIGGSYSEMDDVHTLRNTYGADVCVLILSTASDAAGRAWVNSGSSTAFSVLLYNYATGYYTFAHEIGHNQNCLHDICDDPSGTYNHGYEYCSGNWRTIMATNQSCCGSGTTRIQYWSNPNKTYNGVVMGTTQYEDNARMVDEKSTTIASFKNTFTSGNLTTNQTWYYKTLSGDVTVPSGVTLTLAAGGTIELNGYSIVSTGGTLIKQTGATINGLRARLTANLDLRGLCGSIQTAATYANSTNEILLENGNFNENVSINSKYSLSIFGSSDYNHFGNLTVSSCDAFQGVGFGAKSVFINNASYLILASINAYGTNQSTIGFSLYNSDTYNVNNLTAEYSQTGILCSDGTEADIEQSFLYDNLNGLRSFNGSNISINNSYFCGTGLDLQTYNFSSIEAGNCYYDGGTPSTSGSNIYHYGNQNCPLYKVNSNQQTENSDYVTISNNDKPGGPDFDRINSAYFALNKKLSNSFKEKTDINKEAFSIDYENVIGDFKKFISNNPDSPLAKIALIASAKSYRRIDDIRGKNDFAGMKIFLTDIIENKEYSSLKPQAERLMIDYYRLTKDFTGALKTADNLIENYKEVPDYVCGVLYAKGLILAYDLNQPDKAAESFSYILQQYRKNSLASLAENELRILGKEVGKQTSGEAEIVGNEIELNNYPNPFNPSTTISYSLPEAGNVQIKIFDVLGREVAKLVDETKNAGKHTIIWNGSNNASGIYFYTITFQNQTLFKKMLMIK